MTFKVPEKFRVKTGKMRTTAADGNNGAFQLTSAKLSHRFDVIATDVGGWEHVSVSTPHVTPTWDEMNYIKGLFWDDEDLVVQIHPPKSEYVTLHQHCLHLWRKAGTNDYIEKPGELKEHF